MFIYIERERQTVRSRKIPKVLPKKTRVGE